MKRQEPGEQTKFKPGQILKLTWEGIQFLHHSSVKVQHDSRMRGIYLKPGAHPDTILIWIDGYSLPKSYAAKFWEEA